MKLQQLTTAILLGIATLLLALGCETDSSSDDSSSSDDNPSPKTAITGTFDYLDGNRARFLKGSTVSNIAPKWKNTAENQEANLTYSVIQTLPGTLTINSNTGVISGNAPADASAPVQYTIRATGKGDFTGTKTFGITIIIVESTITYSPIAEGTSGASTPSFVAGMSATDGTFSIAASGTGSTGTVTANAPTIVASSGVITVADATTAGTYMVTFTRSSNNTTEIVPFYVTTTPPNSIAPQEPPVETALETALETGIGHFGLEADFNYIQTSALTSMYGVFSKFFVGETYTLNEKSYIENFNGDISKWDVSNVKTMADMFNGAKKFNGDISKWNVANVTDMQYMFAEASEFNGDINGWNVEKVTDMHNMFYAASEFNGDISSWNVEKVTNMQEMFARGVAFNGDISGWTVNNVKDMSRMFYAASEFNGDISGWTVDNVTKMSAMFAGSIKFNGDISKWNVANVTDMSWMLGGVVTFNRDISGWNVEKVVSIEGMFQGATEFDQDLEDWGEHFTLTDGKATHTGTDTTKSLTTTDAFDGTKLATDSNTPTWY